MDDSLESLLEKATNPRNQYEDWEFIMGFCDKVNQEVQGPQVALRIIPPKIKSENEKVAMLTLALLEACVKNCGQKFHQELGKFKFLNELIRLLSPKYLGHSTPEVVKERIKKLLYSWKVGLPHETKINEAFMMLKREGLIFDETVAPDRTLEPDHVKPKVSLIQDPKQSQMLQKLLASKNPEDLRAANRLIREMVRRDEKRMQKLQKRIEEVELIQNNVKLLNELLLHLKDDSGEQERLLIEELYKTIDKMRPKIFRMASELKENEEGMSDILRTNDSVIRVLDLYKTKMESLPPLPTSNAEGGAASGAGDTSTSGGGGGGDSSAAKAASGEGQGSSEAAASGQNGATTGGMSDILIDLADLNFGGGGAGGGLDGAVGGGGGGAAGNSSTDLNSSLGLSSLMDDISALDLGTPTSSLGVFPPPTSSVGAVSQPPLFPPGPAPVGGVGGFPSSQSAPMGQQMQGGGSPLIGTAPLISSSSSAGATSSNSIASALNPAPSPGLITISPPSQHQASVGRGSPQGKPPSSSANDPFAGLGSLGALGALSTQQKPPPIQQQQATPTLAMAGGASSSQPQPLLDPLSVLDNITVALDTIKPSSLPPLSVMNKNNIAVTFYFAENSPGPGVSVVVISIISTSPLPISNFQFQAAVPKVMRVKLQPPTTMELGAYNPILPPPSISQVMLLANPTKAKIRMKYRISYKQGGGPEVVELGDAADFPSSL